MTVLTGPARRRLLKSPPHLLTDDQLRAVAPYAMVERTTVGVDQAYRLIRELRRRFGLSNLEIVEITGFRLHVVFHAMKDLPPRSWIEMPERRR